MNAEIVTIGTELLLGQIVDTNAAYMAQQLNTIGVSVLYKTTVGDNVSRMKEVLSRALDRADIVLTSGGLGPTEDDLTRKIAAEVTGRKLVLNETLLTQIQGFFLERGWAFKPNNKRQAYIPEGAIPIENPQGTAPGYIIEAKQGILISIPGVPREMKYLLQQTVLPYLKKKLGRTQIIKYNVLKLCGIGESDVDHRISDLIKTSTNPSIGLLAHLGQIDIRLTAKADTPQHADALIAELEEKIRARLPYQIFGSDDDTQESVLVQLLREHSLRLAIAEMNTGGHIGQRLTAVPDSYDVFRGGIVVTDKFSLRNLLNIPERVLDEHGVISLETSKYMAEAVKELCEADIGLGISGYTRSAKEKVLDTSVPSFVAVSKIDGSFTIQEYKMSGSPELIQTRVANIALEFLRQIILMGREGDGEVE
jgi:nicotinamide-nucleotide amidase